MGAHIGFADGTLTQTEKAVMAEHAKHVEYNPECGKCFAGKAFTCGQCGEQSEDGIEVELYCYSKYNVRVRHIAVVCKDCEVDTV